MKIEIDGVSYYDQGVDAGVKTILEACGFGVNEIGQTTFGKVVHADIYSGPLNGESTLIGQVTRNFGETNQTYRLTFDRPNAPNRGTFKRIQTVLGHILVD